MIPQRNLSLLSNRLARGGGRRIPEAVLERDYCLAWFLIGLSRMPLRELVAFKGGTALKRCYFGDYRFSEDLDFTLTADVPFDVIRQGLEPVFAEVTRSGGVSIRFSHEDKQAH
jgi:predicted nucleotidyltransferase component of viral defense system